MSGVYIRNMEMPEFGEKIIVLTSSGYVEDVSGQVINGVEAVPAADVRPVVRGKWIPVGLDDMDEGMYKCSECGSEHFFPENLLGIPADNFCPNCGADMREQPKVET